VLEDMSQEVTIREWVGTGHTCNSIHMIEDEKGIINEIPSHESLNRFKNNFICGFF